jgi:elongation factor G
VQADFYDGKMHPVDSKDIAFQVAGYHAFKEAFLAAQPCLLEPIFSGHRDRARGITLGAIMGDLSSRRGHILGVDDDGHFQMRRARNVPQKELYARTASTVRSLTSGRGRHAEMLQPLRRGAARTWPRSCSPRPKARREADQRQVAP